MPPVHRCPICNVVVPHARKLRPQAYPFCSLRCQRVDLGNWLGGAYVVPAPIAPDDHEAIEAVIAARTGNA